MEFPLQSKIIKRYYSPEWKFLWQLYIKEATIKEFLEFQKLSQENQIESLSNELLSMYTYSFIENIIKFFRTNYIPVKLIKLQQLLLEKDWDWNYIDKILIDILEKRFWSNSIYDWVDLLSIEWQTNKRPIFPWKSLKNVCKEWNIDWPLELINNYTQRQFVFMQDNEIFEAFEQDNNWKINNERAINKSKWDEEIITTEMIKERLKKTK